VRALLLALVAALALAAPADGATSPAERAVLARAAALPEVRAERPREARARRAGGGWQVSFYRGREEVARVRLDAAGRVRAVWTGIQVEWPMARGLPGAFGGPVANHPATWLVLCALFLAPFARPPLRLLHLDLLVLLLFAVPYALVTAAEVELAVPLVYPLLGYLLVRLLLVARGRGTAPPLRPALPLGVLGGLALAVLAVRTGINLTSSNVIDVGYSGVIGADRLTSGERLYGAFPLDNARGDTYGPVTYLAYVPFELAFPWSGTWDDLPAAHAAAIAFDLATAALLYALGRRLRGPVLGTLLLYAWATYPFTLLVQASNANDALVAALVTLALLAPAGSAGRGAAVALAGLTKFAPLALAPLLLAHRPRALLAFAAVAGLALLLVGDLGRFWDRTLGFQGGRDSPFSVWSLWGLDAAQLAAQAGAVALALAVAVLPRRRDDVVVAALAAAVLVAIQLALDHWFFLYLVWFVPPALVALLAPSIPRRTSSMASARRGAEARTSTAFSHGSTSEAS